MSRDEMYKEMFLVSINNTYTEEEMYNIFYKKDGTEKSISEIYESLMLGKLGKQQMILLNIQPTFNHSSPAIFHVQDIGEEREFHYLIDNYYIPEKHDKWKQGDVLEMTIINRDPISDNHNTWIEIDGEIRNLSLEELNMAIEDYKTEFGVKKVNTNTNKFKKYFEEWKQSEQ